MSLTEVIVGAESDILSLHWRVRDNRYVADCNPRIVAITTSICSDVRLMCVTIATSRKLFSYGTSIIIIMYIKNDY